MSTITLSKAKELVGDRGCQVGDFLYMARLPYQTPWVMRSGLGPRWKAQNSMPRPKQLEQKPRSISTSYFTSCPIKPSAGNSPLRKNPAAPAVRREA